MPIDTAFLETIDWSKTPLGPRRGWPRSLSSTVELVLALPTPAIIFWGPEQTQIYNDGYAVIMGPRHPRYFGRPFRESWPDTYPLIVPWMRKVLDEGAVWEVARAHIPLTRHGFTEEAFFSFTFSPLRDDEGRIAGVYQPVLEMTEAVLRERRAETLEALAVREEVLSHAATAFAANPKDIPFAGIFLWSEEERRLKLAAASGFASVEAAGAQLGVLDAALAQSFASGACVELPIAPAPGGPWPEPVTSMFLAPLSRALDARPLGAVAFGLSARLRFDARYREFLETAARAIGDGLSAQRAAQAEREWRERELAARRDQDAAHARRLALLFERAPVGIAVMRGPEHIYEVVNPLFAKLLPDRALLGLPVRQALPELHGQEIFELLDRVYASGESYVGRSVRLSVDRGDGVQEERFFDVVYQPMPGADGATESIMAVAYETSELTRARRDAESANRAKDEFFAILGHELRNPLAPITTALQLMRLRGDEVLVKERAIIERQVAQITRLVDDLLDVSRITRGKVELKKKRIELAQAVAAAIEMASPLLELREHRLSVEVPAHGLIVDADPIRLAQVVSNLLTNAAKYTGPGGHVSVVAKRLGGRACLSVADDGIGISPEMLPRIFEPFAQEEQALDRSQGGLGLGLAIVANLVKLHGGSVKVESAGRALGSTFSIELPLAAGAPGEPRAPVAPEGRLSPALRVLVVDDNQDAAEMLAEAVSLLGHQARVAHDGAETLRVASEFGPDVALLDIGLPVMDGYELAARLRRAQSKPLRLVAVTGYGQESDRQRALQAGFDAHVVKPVQLDVVADLINRFDAAEKKAKL